MTWKIRILISTAAVLFCLFVAPSPAKACRDCPFPTRVGEKQWLLPDSDVIVQIDEARDQGGVTMSVILVDQISGEILAEGTVRRRTYQREVNIVLHDRGGRVVYGSITWVNFKDKMIRARFDCEQDACLLKKRDPRLSCAPKLR